MTGVAEAKRRFGGFELDRARFTLTKAGAPIPIEPLVFDLLAHFVEHPDAVRTRDDLIEHVWGGRIVSDATISSAIKAARRALGDSGAAQQRIKTIRGRGFEFVGPVERGTAALEPGTAAAQAAEGETGALASGRAGVAAPDLEVTLSVRPFRVIGLTAELGLAADGLESNLATVLTRVPMLAVVSAAAPSASLLIEGDVQGLGAGRVAANIRLARGRDGRVLWAQPFEEALDEGVGGRLLEAVLPRLEPQLVRALFETASEAPRCAQALLLRATGVLTLRGWRRATFEEAASLLREAIALEPDLALAHANTALILALGTRLNLLGEGRAVAQQALGYAERALELDDMDSVTLGYAGCALADLGHTARARPWLKRAIELNPQNAQAWTALGAAYLTDHDLDLAIRHLEHGLAISPMDPRRSVWGAILGLAYLHAGRSAEAAAAAERAAESDDRLYLPRLVLAAARAQEGAAAAARDALAEARRIKPDLAQSEIDGALGRKKGAALTAL